MNLPQQIQEYLGYPKLQLIDVNTGLPEDESAFDKLSQAVVISFLTAVFKASRSKETAARITGIRAGNELLNALFEKQEEIIERIAEYSNHSTAITTEKLLETASAFIVQLQKLLPADEAKKGEQLENLLTGERHEILRYLPADLKLGAYLDDKTLDDRTNKMEGPISSLLHKIENSFSTSN
ncbi:hypothetical protein BH11BAC4_BH11BAC4_12000 [soil metagenome]